MKTYIVLGILSLSLNSFAANLDCLDHTNPPEENLICYANAINEALIEACGDHTDSPREVEQCKQNLRDLCFDHTSTPQEILSCIQNNDAV